MGKMRKKYLWRKFVNQQRASKMTHHHWCFSHAFFSQGALILKTLMLNVDGFVVLTFYLQ